MTFTLEIKIPNQHFSCEQFFSYIFNIFNAHFQHMLGWESKHVCHGLRNEMQGI